MMSSVITNLWIQQTNFEAPRGEKNNKIYNFDNKWLKIVKR